jgi:hypothetical protein
LDLADLGSAWTKAVHKVVKILDQSLPGNMSLSIASKVLEVQAHHPTIIDMNCIVMA